MPDITLTDILETINAFASDTQTQFDAIQARLDRMENTMVTKSYLEERLAALHGDMAHP